MKFFKKNRNLILITLFLILAVSIITTHGQIIQNDEISKELQTKQNNLNKKNLELNTYQEEIEKAQSNISKMKNENRTNLKENLTYDDVISFIINDTTNEKEYDDTWYNCAHFSKDANNNAEEQGLKCGYVVIDLKNEDPHAIIAFNTTDAGIVFFEPQTDEKVNLEIGKDYWNECIISDKDYENKQGEIVENYVIYW